MFATQAKSTIDHFRVHENVNIIPNEPSVCYNLTLLEKRCAVLNISLISLNGKVFEIWQKYSNIVQQLQ